MSDALEVNMFRPCPIPIAGTLIAAGLFVGLSTSAAAETQVPAIVQANATAAASSSTSVPAANTTPAASAGTKTAVATAAQAMPPPVHLLSPSAPLDAKEKRAVALARRWKSRREMPQPGEDGVIRFLYGATLPTVVCAPLQVCDLALQPGEIVNNVNIGDKVRWHVSPGVSGSSAGQITHLVIKPIDAGLVSSLLIQTNRRTYAIKLVSTRHQWMPLVAFNYPDDMQREWAAYQQTVAFGAAASTLPSGQNVGNLDFGFRISGDHPGWRPLRVYSDGTKTYIQFPPGVGSTTAPALVALDHDGGWFASPSEQMVNYRMQGDRYIVDRVLDRAELVTGVGSGQTRVLITRDSTP